jgi:hypothetical protein
MQSAFHRFKQNYQKRRHLSPEPANSRQKEKRRREKRSHGAAHLSAPLSNMTLASFTSLPKKINVLRTSEGEEKKQNALRTRHIGEDDKVRTLQTKVKTACMTIILPPTNDSKQGFYRHLRENKTARRVSSIVLNSARAVTTT